MKKFLKVIGIVLGIAVIGLLGAMAYVKLALPDVGAAPEMKVEVTQARVERGEYLAQHVYGRHEGRGLGGHLHLPDVGEADKKPGF